MYVSENWVVCTNAFFMIVKRREKKVEKHRPRLLHARGCVKCNGTGIALLQFQSEMSRIAVLNMMSFCSQKHCSIITVSLYVLASSVFHWQQGMRFHMFQRILCED
jgi:hypothetical protein